MSTVRDVTPNRFALLEQLTEHNAAHGMAMSDILLERVYQLEQGRTALADDGNSLADWTGYIEHQLEKLVDPTRNGVSPRVDYHTLIKVGALALAAAESVYRQHVAALEEPKCSCPRCTLQQMLKDSGMEADVEVVVVERPGKPDGDPLLGLLQRLLASRAGRSR
jgi:hypothetical protein